MNFNSTKFMATRGYEVFDKDSSNLPGFPSYHRFSILSQENFILQPTVTEISNTT